MMTLLRLVPLLLLVSFAARAQPPACVAPIADPVPRDAVRLSWSAPMTYTDGSAIGSAAKTYTVYEASVSAPNARCTTSGTAGSLTGLSVGAHSWVVTATVAGLESAPSNSASKTIAAPIPNPPTGLKVDPASLTAYSPVKTRNTLSMVAVGGVPGGTPCDGSQAIVVAQVTYYALILDPALFPQATALYGKCS